MVAGTSRSQRTVGLALGGAFLTAVALGQAGAATPENRAREAIGTAIPPAISPAATQASPAAPPAINPAAQPAFSPAGQPARAPTAALPGGGTRIFQGKTYVALYGHPGAPSLGVLGEQGPVATIQRAKQVAGTYRPCTRRQIVPALEVIATVASGSAGADGDYSGESPVAKLRPLVDAAGREGVYVVLDLQPGRSDFLSQAKRYRSLLLEPHVGLALDPEWRLKPHQRHLRQIGSVRASEINRVTGWLADLTRDAGLPQKMLLLHQFTTPMIRNRSTLATSRDEVALVIQMDGFGTKAAKRATWRAIRRGAPSRIRFGWKNFIDEDRPMLGPDSTMAISPQPRWVSFQ